MSKGKYSKNETPDIRGILSTAADIVGMIPIFGVLPNIPTLKIIEMRFIYTNTWWLPLITLLYNILGYFAAKGFKMLFEVMKRRGLKARKATENSKYKKMVNNGIRSGALIFYLGVMAFWIDYIKEYIYKSNLILEELGISLIRVQISNYLSIAIIILMFALITYHLANKLFRDKNWAESIAEQYKLYIALDIIVGIAVLALILVNYTKF